MTPPGSNPPKIHCTEQRRPNSQIGRPGSLPASEAPLHHQINAVPHFVPAYCNRPFLLPQPGFKDLYCSMLPATVSPLPLTVPFLLPASSPKAFHPVGQGPPGNPSLQNFIYHPVVSNLSSLHPQLIKNPTPLSGPHQPCSKISRQKIGHESFAGTNCQHNPTSPSSVASTAQHGSKHHACLMKQHPSGSVNSASASSYYQNSPANMVPIFDVPFKAFGELFDQCQKDDSSPSNCSVSCSSLKAPCYNRALNKSDIISISHDINCVVCYEKLRPNEWKLLGDTIVQCSDCGITVHCRCYGIHHCLIPSANDISPPLHFICDLCRFKSKHASTNVFKAPIKCIICDKSDGALRQIQTTAETSKSWMWIHVLCALFSPGLVKIQDYKNLSSIELLSELSLSPKLLDTTCRMLISETRVNMEPAFQDFCGEAQSDCAKRGSVFSEGSAEEPSMSPVERNSKEACAHNLNSGRRDDMATTKTDSLQAEKCYICSSSNGFFIRCSDEECHKVMHVYCVIKRAYEAESEGQQQTTLQLEHCLDMLSEVTAENRKFLMYCSEHAKPTPNCICKLPYNPSCDSAIMVGCDFCGDWLHCSCLEESEAQKALNDEYYMCPRCKDQKTLMEFHDLCWAAPLDDFVRPTNAYTILYNLDNYLRQHFGDGFDLGKCIPPHTKPIHLSDLILLAYAIQWRVTLLLIIDRIDDDWIEKALPDRTLFDFEDDFLFPRYFDYESEATSPRMGLRNAAHHVRNKKVRLQKLQSGSDELSLRTERSPNANDALGSKRRKLADAGSCIDVEQRLSEKLFRTRARSKNKCSSTFEFQTSGEDAALHREASQTAGMCPAADLKLGFGEIQSLILEATLFTFDLISWATLIQNCLSRSTRWKSFVDVALEEMDIEKLEWINKAHQVATIRNVYQNLDALIARNIKKLEDLADVVSDFDRKELDMLKMLSYESITIAFIPSPQKHCLNGLFGSLNFILKESKFATRSLKNTLFLEQQKHIVSHDEANPSLFALENFIRRIETEQALKQNHSLEAYSRSRQLLERVKYCKDSADELQKKPRAALSELESLIEMVETLPPGANVDLTTIRSRVNDFLALKNRIDWSDFDSVCHAYEASKQMPISAPLFEHLEKFVTSVRAYRQKVAPVLISASAPADRVLSRQTDSQTSESLLHGSVSPLARLQDSSSSGSTFDQNQHQSYTVEQAIGLLKEGSEFKVPLEEVNQLSCLIEKCILWLDSATKILQAVKKNHSLDYSDATSAMPRNQSCDLHNLCCDIVAQRRLLNDAKTLPFRVPVSQIEDLKQRLLELETVVATLEECKLQVVSPACSFRKTCTKQDLTLLCWQAQCILSSIENKDAKLQQVLSSALNSLQHYITYHEQWISDVTAILSASDTVLLEADICAQASCSHSDEIAVPIKFLGEGEEDADTSLHHDSRSTIFENAALHEVVPFRDLKPLSFLKKLIHEQETSSARLVQECSLDCEKVKRCKILTIVLMSFGLWKFLSIVPEEMFQPDSLPLLKHLLFIYRKDFICNGAHKQEREKKHFNYLHMGKAAFSCISTGEHQDALDASKTAMTTLLICIEEKLLMFCLTRLLTLYCILQLYSRRSQSDSSLGESAQQGSIEWLAEIYSNLRQTLVLLTQTTHPGLGVAAFNEQPFDDVSSILDYIFCGDHSDNVPRSTGLCQIELLSLITLGILRQSIRKFKCNSRASPTGGNEAESHDLTSFSNFHLESTLESALAKATWFCRAKFLLDRIAIDTTSSYIGPHLFEALIIEYANRQPASTSQEQELHQRLSNDFEAYNLWQTETKKVLASELSRVEFLPEICFLSEPDYVAENATNMQTLALRDGRQSRMLPSRLYYCKQRECPEWMIFDIGVSSWSSNSRRSILDKIRCDTSMFSDSIIPGFIWSGRSSSSFETKPNVSYCFNPGSSITSEAELENFFTVRLTETTLMPVHRRGCWKHPCVSHVSPRHSDATAQNNLQNLSSSASRKMAFAECEACCSHFQPTRFETSCTGCNVWPAYFMESALSQPQEFCLNAEDSNDSDEGFDTAIICEPICSRCYFAESVSGSKLAASEGQTSRTTHSEDMLLQSHVDGMYSQLDRYFSSKMNSKHLRLKNLIASAPSSCPRDAIFLKMLAKCQEFLSWTEKAMKVLCSPLSRSTAAFNNNNCCRHNTSLSDGVSNPNDDTSTTHFQLEGNLQQPILNEIYTLLVTLPNIKNEMQSMIIATQQTIKSDDWPDVHNLVTKVQSFQCIFEYELHSRFMRCIHQLPEAYALPLISTCRLLNKMHYWKHHVALCYDAHATTSDGDVSDAPCKTITTRFANSFRLLRDETSRRYKLQNSALKLYLSIFSKSPELRLQILKSRAVTSCLEASVVSDFSPLKNEPSVALTNCDLRVLPVYVNCSHVYFEFKLIPHGVSSDIPASMKVISSIELIDIFNSPAALMLSSSSAHVNLFSESRIMNAQSHVNDERHTSPEDDFGHDSIPIRLKLLIDKLPIQRTHIDPLIMPLAFLYCKLETEKYTLPATVDYHDLEIFARLASDIYSQLKHLTNTQSPSGNADSGGLNPERVQDSYRDDKATSLPPRSDSNVKHDTLKRKLGHQSKKSRTRLQSHISQAHILSTQASEVNCASKNVPTVSLQQYDSLKQIMLRQDVARTKLFQLFASINFTKSKKAFRQKCNFETMYIKINKFQYEERILHPILDRCHLFAEELVSVLLSCEYFLKKLQSRQDVQYQLIDQLSKKKKQFAGVFDFMTTNHASVPGKYIKSYYELYRDAHGNTKKISAFAAATNGRQHATFDTDPTFQNLCTLKARLQRYREQIEHPVFDVTHEQLAKILLAVDHLKQKGDVILIAALNVARGIPLPKIEQQCLTKNAIEELLIQSTFIEMEFHSWLRVLLDRCIFAEQLYLLVFKQSNIIQSISRLDIAVAPPSVGFRSCDFSLEPFSATIEKSRSACELVTPSFPCNEDMYLELDFYKSLRMLCLSLQPIYSPVTTPAMKLAMKGLWKVLFRIILIEGDPLAQPHLNALLTPPSLQMLQILSMSAKEIFHNETLAETSYLDSLLLVAKTAIAEAKLSIEQWIRMRAIQHCFPVYIGEELQVIYESFQARTPGCVIEIDEQDNCLKKFILYMKGRAELHYNLSANFPASEPRAPTVSDQIMALKDHLIKEFVNSLNSNTRSSNTILDRSPLDIFESILQQIVSNQAYKLFGPEYQKFLANFCESDQVIISILRNLVRKCFQIVFGDGEFAASERETLLFDSSGLELSHDYFKGFLKVITKRLQQCIHTSEPDDTHLKGKSEFQYAGLVAMPTIEMNNISCSSPKKVLREPAISAPKHEETLEHTSISSASLDTTSSLTGSLWSGLLRHSPEWDSLSTESNARQYQKVINARICIFALFSGVSTELIRLMQPIHEMRMQEIVNVQSFGNMYEKYKSKQRHVNTLFLNVLIGAEWTKDDEQVQALAELLKPKSLKIRLNKPKALLSVDELKQQETTALKSSVHVVMFAPTTTFDDTDTCLRLWLIPPAPIVSEAYLSSTIPRSNQFSFGVLEISNTIKIFDKTPQNFSVGNIRSTTNSILRMLQNNSKTCSKPEPFKISNNMEAFLSNLRITMPSTNYEYIDSFHHWEKSSSQTTHPTAANPDSTGEGVSEMPVIHSKYRAPPWHCAKKSTPITFQSDILATKSDRLIPQSDPYLWPSAHSKHTK